MYESVAHDYNKLLGDSSRKDNIIEQLNNTIASEQRLSHERIMEARKYFAECGALRLQIRTLLAALAIAAEQLVDVKQKDR
jgi:hypothetical protein